MRRKSVYNIFVLTSKSLCFNLVNFLLELVKPDPKELSLPEQNEMIPLGVDLSEDFFDPPNPDTHFFCYYNCAGYFRNNIIRDVQDM